MRLVVAPLLSLLVLFPISSLAGTSQVNIELHDSKMVRLSKKPHTIYLTQNDIADYILRSPGILFVSGKKIGHTKLQVLDDSGHILESFDLNVTYPEAGLKELIQKVAPDAKVHFETSGSHLFLEGYVPTSLDHQRILTHTKKYLAGVQEDLIIDLMRVNEQSQQVNLRVKLIEVSRELSRAVGLNFSGIFQTSKHYASFGVDTTALSTGATTVFDLAGDAGNQFGNFNLSSILNILDSEKLATVIAEPNITTISGETATIEVGGEVPITSSTTGLVPSNSVEYKTYGIKLAFTPNILENGRIRIKVEPQVSRPLGSETSTLVNPAFLTRSASTTVELMSGQSFAIAGLLENKLEEEAHQVPGADKIPIVKDVLRQERGDHTEREFIIVIVPYIVQPTTEGMKQVVSADQVKLDRETMPGFIAH